MEQGASSTAVLRVNFPGGMHIDFKMGPLSSNERRLPKTLTDLIEEISKEMRRLKPADREHAAVATTEFNKEVHHCRESPPPPTTASQRVLLPRRRSSSLTVHTVPSVRQSWTPSSRTASSNKCTSITGVPFAFLPLVESHRNPFLSRPSYLLRRADTKIQLCYSTTRSVLPEEVELNGILSQNAKSDMARAHTGLAAVCYCCCGHCPSDLFVCPQVIFFTELIDNADEATVPAVSGAGIPGRKVSFLLDMRKSRIEIQDNGYGQSMDGLVDMATIARHKSTRGHSSTRKGKYGFGFNASVSSVSKKWSLHSRVPEAAVVNQLNYPKHAFVVEARATPSPLYPQHRLHPDANHCPPSLARIVTRTGGRYLVWRALRRKTRSCSNGSR